MGTPVLLLKRHMIVKPTVLEYFGFHVAFGSVVDVSRHSMIKYLHGLWQEAMSADFIPYRYVHWLASCERCLFAEVCGWTWLVWSATRRGCVQGYPPTTCMQRRAMP